MAILMLLSTLSFSGCLVETCNTCNTPPPCSYGPDGYPGPAFFGLDWSGVQPSYVWTNNTAIPPTFRYGTYYNSFPGSYQLYYEGAFLNGCCLTEYYWDVDFLVWVNSGTTGGCGFVGADGLPSYLMLVMGINGPGGDNHAFKDGMGIGLKNASVHKGAGVTFIGIAQNIFDFSRAFARKLPL